MKTVNVFEKAESTTQLPEGVAVQPRKPDVEAVRKLPKLWFGGNPAITAASNVFSIYIPPGERFFIRSVRHYKDRLKDPEQIALVRAFMQQETLHGKAHDDYNDSFRDYGLDVDFESHYAEKTFNWIEKYVPAKLCLGMTVFSEHLTAVGAASSFVDKNFIEWADDDAVEFWQWHAAEELEHKAVAFDVLTRVGGGYFTRVFSALLTLVLMIVPLFRSYKRVYRALNTRMTKEHRRQLRTMQNSDAAKIQMKLILEYFKPGFHPWKQDDSGLLRDWLDGQAAQNGIVQSDDDLDVSGNVAPA